MYVHHFIPKGCHVFCLIQKAVLYFEWTKDDKKLVFLYQSLPVQRFCICFSHLLVFSLVKYLKNKCQIKNVSFINGRNL